MIISGIFKFEKDKGRRLSFKKRLPLQLFFILLKELSACKEQNQNGEVFILAVLHNSAGGAYAVISASCNAAN